jgi:hypothetical protein
MAQNGYTFTPGQYDRITQTDVVPEQEKSNARILASEEKFLEEMNARDDALVENTRKNWESLSNLSSSVASWIQQKAEKDKKEKLQAGAAYALKMPATAEDIQALIDQENGLHDSHLQISKIADRIEEETGSFELAEEFRNLSGWKQYAYVKASLQRAAGNYTDFKNEKRATTFLTLKDGTEIRYNNANEAQRRGLDAKIRHEFSEQFIGVNEKLLSATVAPEILKVDEAEIAEARQERNKTAKQFAKDEELRGIENIITTDSARSLELVNQWIERNSGIYGGINGSRLAFRRRVVDLVKSGQLSFFEARGLVTQKFYHTGDKKEVTLEKFKEFDGFLDELTKANNEYRRTKLDDDKFTVEAEAEALRKQIEESGKELTIEQKKNYIKLRNERFPDVPLNQDEQFFIYGYRDDNTMRTTLLQKVESSGGITQLDLKEASPTIRREFQSNLVPDGNTQISSMAQLNTKDQKYITDLVGVASKQTGTLESKDVHYYALLNKTEELYVQTYNETLKHTKNPAMATEAAQKIIGASLQRQEWIDNNSKFEEYSRNSEYERKLVRAQRQVQPETKGYITTLLEAPQAQKEDLLNWAKKGGKGPVPYYYRALAQQNRILPRELAWKQANILSGNAIEFDGDEEIKQFNIPPSMLYMFLEHPTKNGYTRFNHDVNTINNEEDENEVHPYEEDEDID